MERYFATLSDVLRQGIEGVAMDMWEPYVQATLKALPLAKDKIVYDRFHIMQHMTKAVDQVRKAENRKLLLEGDERRKKIKYLWLTTEKNLSEKQEAAFEALKNSDLRTARAWGIKENLRNPWSYTSPGWAKRFFGQWYKWAVRSRLEPVKKVAAMIQRRLENVITYCTHFIKSKIFERVAIIFHAGVDPNTVQKNKVKRFVVEYFTKLWVITDLKWRRQVRCNIAKFSPPLHSAIGYIQ